MENTIQKLFKTIGVNVNLDNIDGFIIERNMLIDNTKNYELIKKHIPYLKKTFSSSFLTSLQCKATETQKWPLLNLIRQVLKACNYKMKPIRKSNGYTKSGKKLYKRYFKIEKIIIKSKKEINI